MSKDYFVFDQDSKNLILYGFIKIFIETQKLIWNSLLKTKLPKSWDNVCYHIYFLKCDRVIASL